MYQRMDESDPVQVDDGDSLTIALWSDVCGTDLHMNQADPCTLPQFQ